MKLSVIILNYNVCYFLQQCILSVQSATAGHRAEIIVVDNASTDGSPQHIPKKFPTVKYIQNTKNVGFAKANNQAVSQASGEFICILNPDTAVAEDTFTKCFKYFGASKNIGALGVRYLDGTGNFLPEGKRNLPTPKVSFLKLLGMGKSYYVQNIGEGGSGKVPVLAGAFMFMKKETYQQVQGFDETYFMYGEDIDLSYKLLKAGYENHYTGAAQILHYKGESTQKDTVYLERFYKAMHVFYTKHFNYGSVPNAAVALGLWLAKIIKRLGFATVAKKMPPRQQALLFSKNPALIKKLTPIIDVPLRAALQTALQQGSIRNTLFVFDAEHMGYGAIFQAMQRYKNMGNSFRVRPKGCNFILGSDHSGTMGEVLHF